MAVTNFIPSIWARSLLENLNKSLVYGQPGVINTDYAGDIAGAGSSVRINSIGRVSVSDYTANSDMADPEVLSGAQVVLTIDQQRSFSFQIDDVDNAQTIPKLMAGAMAESAYALADDMDQHLAGVMSTEAGLSVTATSDPYETLVDAFTALDEANAPSTGRWAIVPPFFHGLLRKDDRFVSFGTSDNRSVLENGVIGQAAGFTVLVSNNVPEAAGVYSLTFGHPSATTHAMQVSKVEAYRMEKRFSDAVKGLEVYGSKVVRPEILGTIEVTR